MAPARSSFKKRPRPALSGTVNCSPRGRDRDSSPQLSLFLISCPRVRRMRQRRRRRRSTAAARNIPCWARSHRRMVTLLALVMSVSSLLDLGWRAGQRESNTTSTSTSKEETPNTRHGGCYRAKDDWRRYLADCGGGTWRMPAINNIRVQYEYIRLRASAPANATVRARMATSSETGKALGVIMRSSLQVCGPASTSTALCQHQTHAVEVDTAHLARPAPLRDLIPAGPGLPCGSPSWIHRAPEPEGRLNEQAAGLLAHSPKYIHHSV